MRGVSSRSYPWVLALVSVACGNSTRGATETATQAADNVTSATTAAVGGSTGGVSTSSTAGVATSGGATSGAGGKGGSAGDEASSGVTSSGGASGGAAPEEAHICNDDSDCLLLDDCCSCRAVSREADINPCAADCAFTRCSAAGHEVPNPVCLAGRCRLTVNCNASDVTCRIAPPKCAPGELPEVVDACYTGRCFEARQCNRVASCNDCAEDDACVNVQTQAFSYHCVASVSGCSPDDCECMQACDGLACAEGIDSDLACFCLGC